mmetsp:Transcript_39308/g.96187  ORF Transcript_39308/g.96187 Transcript_39308/m.96187 type:complete len:106 (+) Transcript_39308:442-759(+)
MSMTLPEVIRGLEAVNSEASILKESARADADEKEGADALDDASKPCTESRPSKEAMEKTPTIAGLHCTSKFQFEPRGASHKTSPVAAETTHVLESFPVVSSNSVS